MEAVKVRVQVSCPPREVNGTKFNAFYRCGRGWPVGKTEAEFIVVRDRDAIAGVEKDPEKRIEAIAAVHAAGAVLESQFQGLVDEAVLSVLILSHSKTTIEPKPIAKSEAKPSILDQLEAEKPQPQQPQKR